MPLIASFFLSALLGGATALAAARELRLHAQSILRLTAFRALALHLLAVALPASGYVLGRFTDWVFSYLFDASRVPSIVLGVLALLQLVVAVGAFLLGAQLVRDHREGSLRVVLLVLGCSAAMAPLFAKTRFTLVVTYAQFRGAYGLRPFWQTGVLTPVFALCIVELLAAGHMFWFLSRNQSSR